MLHNVNETVGTDRQTKEDFWGEKDGAGFMKTMFKD